MKKVSVLLWLYHTDLAEEFKSLLESYSDLVDIHVSLCEDNDNTEAIKTFNTLKNIKSITYYPNCGADVYSFLNELTKINTEYFIKLHSKKSKWGTLRHCDWREILTDSLMGDRETLIRNIKILSQNTGYLSCKPLTYTNDEGKNSEKITELLNIIDCQKINRRKRKFSGGNMFGGNTKLFQKIFSPHLNTICNLVKKETGQINDILEGKYCHSLERIFGYIANLQDHSFAYASPDTFKIMTPFSSQYSLNFRIMNNKYIYCVDQLNIYGKIVNKNKRFLRILWLHRKDADEQYYVPIDKKRFINTKYVS
jgi:lipopolysaccharide biosynthesis protein